MQRLWPITGEKLAGFSSLASDTTYETRQLVKLVTGNALEGWPLLGDLAKAAELGGRCVTRLALKPCPWAPATGITTRRMSASPSPKWRLAYILLCLVASIHVEPGGSTPAVVPCPHADCRQLWLLPRVTTGPTLDELNQ